MAEEVSPLFRFPDPNKVSPIFDRSPQLPGSGGALEDINRTLEAVKETQKTRDEATVGKISARRRRTRQGKLLTYPYELKTRTTDYLEIRVIDYSRPSGLTSTPGSRQTSEGTEGLVKVRDSNGNLVPSAESAKRLKDILRVIQLPIPSNVQDGNSVSYEGATLNGLVAAAAGGTQDLIRSLSNISSPSEIYGVLENILTKAGTQVGDAGIAADFVNKYLVSQAVGVLGGNITPNQLFAREQGVILNPNMELLFNGPTLRQFRFSFKMTPRDNKESVEIAKIINEFKQSMAPKVTNEGGGNLFLKTPNVFELRYRKGTGNHPFLHRFKQCALTDMSVNYTGEGTYASYGDGTPISMIMDLTFKELEPVYDIDYDNVGGVGY
jgi:hypothetical protein